MKVLLKVVLQIEIKQCMVAKWPSFFVAISLDKGICYCKRYEKLRGKIFAEFIKNIFIEIFKSSCNPAWNVFVQDDDPPKLLKLP